MRPNRDRYRRDLQGGWLREIGPRPTDYQHYRWRLPTPQEQPGEFWLNELRGFVPRDRYQRLENALDRSYHEGPERLTERLRKPNIRVRIHEQIEAHADYADQFKIIGNKLYRRSAEPYVGLGHRSIAGNNSAKDWRTEAHNPSALYSYAETDLLLKMLAAVQGSDKYGHLIEEFEIGDPSNFTPSFLERRMTLLVSWMSALFWLRSQDLTRAGKARIQSTVANYIDGGLNGLRAAAFKARDGVLDNHLLDIAEAIFEMPLHELFEGALVSDLVLTIVATLREEWEGRPVVVQARY